MKIIKDYDIVILLFALLVFSLGVGWIYSKPNDKKPIQQKKLTTKKEEAPLQTTVKAPPKTPEPPKEIPYKTTDIPKVEMSLNEMMDYIREWANESGVPEIIKFLKEICPKDKIVTMVKQITKQYTQELTRENKIKLAFSLANFYKKDKNIQNKIFEIIANDKTIIEGDIPLIFIAAQQGEIDAIPNMIDWYKKHRKRRVNLEKKTFAYAAKHDYANALQKLQKKLHAIDKAYATKLLWILVKANAGKKSIEFLANLGADLNYQDPKTKHTILIQAIINKNPAVVKELVRLGADVKKPSQDKSIGYPVQVARENPVKKARELGLTDIEMFLRSKGASD